ncbi:MAG: radical SAM protein [Elusimicrobiales bacterium]|nr:radical SAM protein [Elusimicrobiales bacterium]
MEPNVFVTDRCGRDCLYCSARGEDRLMTRAQIREVLERRYPALVFEGGEPLLSPELERWVRAAARRGTRDITVLTNGLALTPARFASLRKAGVGHFHFNFPSHLPKTHDELTGTRGRLKAQAAVIKRVAAAGPRAASLVCVINSLNYRQLPAYVAYAARNFPGLFYVALNFVKVKGMVKDRPWLVPDLRRVSPYLRKALAAARRLGLPCLVDGVPLCFLQGFEAHARDADCLTRGDGTYLGEKRRVAACRRCGLSPVCAGPRADYLELRGDAGFRAAPPGAARPVMLAVAGGQISLNRPAGTSR